MATLASDDPVLLDTLRHDEADDGVPVLHAYPDPLSPLSVQLHKPAAERVKGWQSLSGAPWTIGFGSTGEGIDEHTVWTPELCELHLRADVVRAITLLDTHARWWRDMSLMRQRVVANMCFNMGWLSADGRHGLATFKNTLGAMQRGDYAGAAAGMRASAWSGQVGGRARRLASQMELG